MKYLLSQISQICGGELFGVDRWVECVVTDSRSFASGDGRLFVAMKGANHDSHKYIDDMLHRGVESFMVEDRGSVRYEDRDLVIGDKGSFIVVENSIRALQLLATNHRKTFGGEVVAITGSNGKTVIKEWIVQSVPNGVKLFRSPRSYNSQLGVALSILMIEGDEDIAVIEAGISERGEMSKLVEMIQPNIVIFSSIGDAHSEGFRSIDEKICEKMILCRDAQKLIFHSDYTELKNHLPKIETIDAIGFKGGDFADVALRRNSQIVEAFCCEMGYSQPNFETLRPIAMRLEVREGINESVIINDSYNSDINSLGIAIDQLRWVASGRKTTLILSDILQSGTSTKELYIAVSKIVKSSDVNSIIGVGSQISAMAELFDCDKKFFSSTEELLSKISRDDYAGRAILLKGNRDSRFEKISHALSYKSHTTTLEVNLDSMIHNFNYFRSLLKPKVKLTAMVKASSYGAGDYEIAQTLQHQGVDYLAVAFADEGQRLRERGITMPIIVLNADDGSFSQMIDYRLEPEIYSMRSLEAFVSTVDKHGEREYPIHIKLDTGMHRLGFEEFQIDELNQKLIYCKDMIKVASIFSHLCTSDMANMDDNTISQVERFHKMCDAIKQTLKYSIITHIENSAAIARFADYQADMCRLGIGLYGFGWGEGLRPISTLKSRIVQIKELSADQTVGYACAGILKRKSRIATIPIGYADGLDRALGCGKWSMLINEQRAPIIGRICMDSCMVDITDIEGVREGDEVIIFSPTKGNTAEDMANILGTISYEVLTSVSSRVKRIYIKE
ncbi:MAG: alanine racemase [Rikenellaceae bacterium]